MDLAPFQQILAHASRSPGWIVVLTPPDSKIGEELRNCGIGLYPVDTKHVGRTAIFPKGGRLTVAELMHRFNGEEFDLICLGFDTTTLTSKHQIRLHEWFQEARRVISLGEAPGQVIVHS